jgi:3-dehydroquinate synthase
MGVLVPAPDVLQTGADAPAAIVRHPRAADGVDAAVSPSFVHRLRFTEDAFDPANPILDEVVDAAGEPGPTRAILVVDDGVLAADPHGAEAGLRRLTGGLVARAGRLDLRGEPLIVPGGEAAKLDRTVVDRVMQAIHDHGICRRSFVLVVGGGAVLDAVGFAAATAHRGVRLIRFPTTTLAQDDAGIGVKNGINAFGKKNFIGAFAVPWAVINDRSFLATQSLRDRRAGLSEAIKVGLLKDAGFVDAIEAAAPALAAGDLEALDPVVRRSAELHLEHIAAGGDPFESEIARPLDFGHWSAHRLEQMTDFAVRHGEAVAIGIAIDATYAARIGRLPTAEAERIIAMLEGCGLPTRHPDLARGDELMRGLEEFREHLGGRLTITLIAGRGEPFDVHEIDAVAMREALAARTGPWIPPGADR